ncbi:Nusap1 [Phodopus roborovskii]|uniref:Nusap1 protein n=2 Tax=Phodopus roborovskii TaxID=109678 RepID=A0AAU9Z7M1_PHORO|nr:Nusap1 [Phodopus roborovskii]
MTVPSAEELDSFKYSDLQNLAKRLGLRANQRADKLLKALKAHLNAETRKENKSQDENQASAFSCDEAEIHINCEEQAEREPVGHITKTRRKRKSVHGTPNFQDHSEMKRSDPTLQNQGKQENQDLRTTTKVPSLPDQSQEEGSTVSSGKSGVDDNKDSERPLEKRSLCTDGFSKLGNNKRTTTTTPNFKRLHEAHFKKMESIDEYIVRKKKHLNDHNSLNELKPEKKGLVTPVPARGRLSVPCTPARQQFSQGQSHGPESQGLKGLDKHSVLSATKMNVRFSATTKDNEHKCSLTKTPARKSPHVSLPGSAYKGQAVLRTPKLMTTERSFLKTTPAVITPFKLTTEATQTPGSSKKPLFDLKASLSRPLNYKPHKGKLKPWGQSKENGSLKEGENRVSIHKKTYKQPHLRTREEQRKKHEQERKERKAKVLEARRNLVLPKAH